MKLRLPEAMRDRIAELAKQNGRSMNAEIVQRLEWALKLAGEPAVERTESVQQPIAGVLSWLITTLIKELAEREGVPFDEMLAKIVLAGLHPEAPQVLYLPLLPGATQDELRAALRASKEVAHPDAAIISESLERAPWAPEWMVERLRQPDFLIKTKDGEALIVEMKKSQATSKRWDAAQSAAATPSKKTSDS
jgi:hypothetical protein